MVLTAAQQAAFFANQMLVPAATRLQMVNEGMSAVQDLLECNENMLDSLEDRLRKPGQGIAPFVFSPVTKNRLLQASQLMKFCNAVGRPVTVPSMQHTVIKSFYLQFKALLTGLSACTQTASSCVLSFFWTPQTSQNIDHGHDECDIHY